MGLSADAGFGTTIVFNHLQRGDLPHHSSACSWPHWFAAAKRLNANSKRVRARGDRPGSWSAGHDFRNGYSGKEGMGPVFTML